MKQIWLNLPVKEVSKAQYILTKIHFSIDIFTMFCLCSDYSKLQK